MELTWPGMHPLCTIMERNECAWQICCAQSPWLPLFSIGSYCLGAHAVHRNLTSIQAMCAKCGKLNLCALDSASIKQWKQ